MYKSNILFKTFYPKFIWDLPSIKPTIYLTFDDGPIPDVTDFVLENLNKYNAKATFFCIGENVVENSTIFNKILVNGHSIGNHTMNHLNGWITDNEQYINNFNDCQTIIPETNLFRPPYGKIKKSQAKTVLKTHKIIMWDVISGDFLQEMNPEKCLKICLKYSESGTVIVFHDSTKAYKNMSYVLPRYIEHFKEKGFEFEPIILEK